MTNISKCWVLAMLVACPGIAVAAGGDGYDNRMAPRAPVLIHDVYELQNMSKDLFGSYELANDIDASATRKWNEGKGFDPVGTWSAECFNGTLEGAGHRIAGLYINRPSEDNVGLFGGIGSNTVIRALHLVDANITGQGFVAGMSGTSDQGRIVDCTIQGFIFGKYDVGGFWAYGWGAITNCSIQGSLESTTGRVGGIACSSWGDISGCFSNVSASGIYAVGGLLGYHGKRTLLDCHSAGTVNGGSKVGGLVGEQYSDSGITNCYSTCAVNGEADVGGLVGRSAGTVSASFWDTDASGCAESAGGTGKGTADMMKRATFTSAGWDLSAVWNIEDGKTYPYLRALYSLPEIVAEGAPWTTEEDSHFVGHVETRFMYYPPGNALEVSMETDCGSWLSYDSATGDLSGTPDDPDVGVHWINITATDTLGNQGSLNLTLTVVNVNDPPAITTADVTTAEEDTLYCVTYIAADPDPTNDPLVWSMASNASWLQLAGSRLYGTPGSKQVGTYWINISVMDGNGGSDFHNFTLTVKPASGRPAITTVPPTTAIEGTHYFVQFTASYTGTGGPLAWSLYTTAAWLDINATTGILSGTPGPNSWGEYCVTVTVTDSKGYSDRVSYTLWVIDVDQPPAWSSVPADTNITQGDTLSLDSKATDPEIEDTVLYGITSRPPSGITIDPYSGAIRWPNAAAGTYIVTITATDGNSTISHLFILVVNTQHAGIPSENHPPRIEPVADASATAGRAFILRLDASDDDYEDDPNLTFRLVSGPAGMVVSADGILLWVPGDDQTGAQAVTVAVTDGKNTTTAAFSVTVLKPAERAAPATGEGVPPAWLAATLLIGLAAGAAIVYLVSRKPPR